MSVISLDTEHEVKKRYESASHEREDALCCPVDYDPQYLKVIPPEILERDYGCGDPSRFVKEGETVLDLGSGGGKICYIISQIVGPQGRVIGVDFNPPMLELARTHQKNVSEKIGWDNITFLRGHIQDLKTDIGLLEARLKETPIHSIEDHQALEAHMRAAAPLVESDSVDVIVSNCVLNLVRVDEKKALFAEMFRVLKTGGRLAISDIVSDEVVPQEMQDDPELWSGCISGAYEERAFLRAFEEAGFYGLEIAQRDEKPWRTVEGIEFRSLTLTAFKGKEGPCMDYNQAVIYNGPWSKVFDDDGHMLERGVRTAVCEKTFQIYSKEPYERDITPVAPLNAVRPEDAKVFECRRNAVRHPKETKGEDYHVTTQAGESCC